MEEFNPAYLPLYKNMMDSLRLLKKKDMWSFLEAADTYYRTGVVIDMTYTAKILFTSVKYAFDESKKNYFHKVSVGKKSAEVEKKNASVEMPTEEIQVQHPSTEMQQPSTEMQQPSVEMQQPSVEMQQPSTEMQQPSTESFASRVQERRPTVSHKESPTTLNISSQENRSLSKQISKCVQYTMDNTPDYLCDST